MPDVGPVMMYARDVDGAFKFSECLKIFLTGFIKRRESVRTNPRKPAKDFLAIDGFRINSTATEQAAGLGL
jgi:hypothetical protein